MDCKYLGACPFFNDQMPTIPLAVDLYKANFCKGNVDGCARYVVREALGKDGVPDDLYPNEMELAQAILGSRAP